MADYYDPNHPDLLPPGNRSISQRGAYLEGIDELIARNRAEQQGRVGDYVGNERARQRQIELEQMKADYITGADGMPQHGVDAYGPPAGSPDAAPPPAPPPVAPPPQAPGMMETSRTVQSRQMHPDAEAWAKQQAQGIMKQATMVGGQAQLHRETGRQISMQMQAIDQAKKRGIDGLEEYMFSLEDTYAQADADLASLRVDPDKWEKETPVLAQVLLAVAAGAAGFASGGRGPNPIVQLIENAIDRDISAQEKNIAIKIKKGKLRREAADKMGHVRSALSAAYVERALDGLSAIKMNSQTEMAASHAAAAEAEMAPLAAKVMTDYYNSAVTTTQSTYQMVGTGVADKKSLTANDITKIENQAKHLGTAGELADRLEEYMSKGGTINPVNTTKVYNWLIGNGEPGEIHAKLQSMFRRLGRADGVDVGNLSEKEGEILVNAGTGKSWDMGPEALTTLVKVVRMARKGLEAKYKALSKHHDVSVLDPFMEMSAPKR